MDRLMLLERAEDQLVQVIDRLDEAEMDVLTNCPPWTVRRLASHVLKNQLFWAGSVTGQQLMALEESMGAVPYDGDLAPIAAEVAAQVLELWRGDGVMTAQHDTPFGVLPGAVVIDFAIIDAAAHAWDLSASLGRAIDFPAETIPDDGGRRRAHLHRPHGRAGPGEAADRAARRRHRHRTADGRRRSHHPPLTARYADSRL